MIRSALIIVAASLALLARAFATDALDDDGIFFVLAHDQRDLVGLWYHMGYTSLAALVSAIAPSTSTLAALQWTSAVCGAAAVALIAGLPGARAVTALLASVALGASPGWWINATRIELHTCQLATAALLIVVAFAVSGTWGRPSTTWLKVVFLVAACCAAIVGHRSNVVLLPGVVWIASAGRPRRGAAVACAAVIGWSIAAYVNRLGTPDPTQSLEARTLAVVVEHWRGFDLGHVWRELLAPWFPALMFPFVMGFTPSRTALQILLCVLPGAAFFSCFGVPTAGGYFAPMAWLLAVLPVVAPTDVAPTDVARRRGPWRHVILVALLVCGVVASRTVVLDETRAQLEAVGEQRLALARSLLPHGGAFLQLDFSSQVVSGRDPLIEEIPIHCIAATLVRTGGRPEELVDLLRERIAAVRARNRPVAFSCNAAVAARLISDKDFGLVALEHELRTTEGAVLVELPFETFVVVPGLPSSDE